MEWLELALFAGFGGVFAENGGFCQAGRSFRNLCFGRLVYEAFGPAKSAVRSIEIGHGFGSIVTRQMWLGGGAVEEVVGSEGVLGAQSP